MDTFVKFR